MPTKKPKDRADTWRDNCLHSGNMLVASLANVLVCLRDAPAFRGLVGFDEMAQRTVLFALPGGDWIDPRPLTDHDTSLIQERLQHVGFQRLGRDLTAQALDAVAREAAFNPVTNYLAGLQWDGVHRLDSWLETYLGASPLSPGSKYLALVGSKFFISLVARAAEPGCKCDSMLILEGRQGTGKSRALSVIGGEWFADSLPDLARQDKDCSIFLSGVWLIEVSELSAISRAEASLLKAFLSRRIERYRPVHARHEVEQPRTCVLAGSTNEKTYLRDSSGGRRFWPVKVGRIDIDALEADRDQLFAEAVERYRGGENWWPSVAEEYAEFRQQQDERYERDLWEEAILPHLNVNQHRGVTIYELARDVLGIQTQRLGTYDQRRIAAILERAGWIRGKQNAQGRLEFRSPLAQKSQKPPEDIL